MIVAPSILSADFGCLGESIAMLESGGAACGYGYELAHSRNEAAEECGGCAVVVEVFFGFLYLLLPYFRLISAASENQSPCSKAAAPTGFTVM